LQGFLLPLWGTFSYLLFNSLMSFCMVFFPFQHFPNNRVYAIASKAPPRIPDRRAVEITSAVRGQDPDEFAELVAR
jgi:hypothetical protein